MPGFRRYKERLRELLAGPDWESGLTSLADWPARDLLSPLLSLLLAPGEGKWRAVTALGLTVARLAGENWEPARVLLRRLMWNLSEESGTLGWGSPEAMGEILACHDGLAQEFHRVLCSYIHDSAEPGNYIDHAPLRLGACWAVARLAQARPLLVRPAWPDLVLCLDSRGPSPGDCAPALRGVAAWGLSLLARADIPPADLDSASRVLSALRDDASPFELFRNRRLETLTVAEVAAEALSALRAAVSSLRAD